MVASFTEIVALAKDKTPAGRRRLATQFTDAFFTNKASFSGSERALALDILTAVLRDAALEVRAELAQVLAREPVVPSALIAALANDVIEVAQPVLRHSPALSDEEMVHVLTHKGTEYKVALAQREHLSDHVTEQLSAVADHKVALTLLSNIAIHIPHAAMRHLAERALEYGDVADMLAQRAELTDDIATRIYWMIGEQLRQQVSGRFDLDPQLIEKAMQETVQRLAQRQNDPQQRRSMAMRLIASGTVNGQFMAELLKNRGIELFRDLLAGLTKLKPNAIDVLCRPEGSEPLALAFRALGYSKTETASLLMLVRDRVAGENQFNPAMLADALTTFSRLTVGDAKTVLWQWQADPDYLFSLSLRRTQ